MNRINTIELSDKVRVAVIIESGKLTPRWFDLLDKPSRERVHVKEICYRWCHCEGTAKIFNFAVSDGANTYCLSLNTLYYTWKLGIAGEVYDF